MGQFVAHETMNIPSAAKLPALPVLQTFTKRINMLVWKTISFLLGFVVTCAATAQSVTWHEDVFTAKSCKKLVAYQQASGMRASDRSANPGKWAVTKSNLRVGDVLASDPRSLDEISFEGKVEPGPRGGLKSLRLVSWPAISISI